MIERALIARMLFEYMANALWQIPLLAGGAWLLLTAVKAGPRAQYGVWLGVLGLAVLLPLHGMGGTGAVAVQVTDAASGARMLPVAAQGETAQSLQRQEAVRGLDQARELDGWFDPFYLSVSSKAADWLVAMYLGLVLFGLCRVVWAWRMARRLVEGSQEIALVDDEAALLERCGRRLGVRLPEVRESAAASSPVVVGAVRPVLLLPRGFARYSEAERRAAVLHELAHVKRRDYLVNAVCRVVGLPVVWHPAAHWVQGRVRRSREMVCDAMAAEEMESEVGYARCLLSLAKDALARRKFEREMAGMGLFGSDVLEERVMRLMETKQAMTMRTKLVRVASGATVMLLAMAVAVTFHVTPTLAASKVALPEPVMIAAAQAAAVAPIIAQANAPNADAAAAKQVTAQRGTAVGRVAKKPVVHKRDTAGRTAVVVKDERPLTAEEKLQVDEAVAAGQRAMAEATAKLNSPEFKRQIADAQAEAMKAKELVNSPEFKKQIADAKAQAIKSKELVNSPEFKEQIADAKAQAMKSKELVNSPEFKKQIADAKAQAIKAKELVNSPEFKKQMADMQKQVEEATAKINSPEFRKQMEDAQKINMQEVQRKVDEAMRQMNESMQKMNESMSEDSKSK